LTENPPEPEGVGRPRAGCAVRILDPHGNRIVGEAGDIAIAGPHRLAEYFGQPERNAEAIKDGWFLPGDLGMLAKSGRLHVLGRKEDAIAKGGRYIRPLEIEDVAMTIPGVAEAGVAASPAGAAEQKIILAIAPDIGGTLTEAGIRAALQAGLPASHQPDLIVIAPELPHGNDASGGRGKLLRRTIRDLYESRL
jgi:fatty-acyl-CoA synthase